MKKETRKMWVFESPEGNEAFITRIDGKYVLNMTYIKDIRIFHSFEDAFNEMIRHSRYYVCETVREYA